MREGQWVWLGDSTCEGRGQWVWLLDDLDGPAGLEVSDEF